MNIDISFILICFIKVPLAFVAFTIALEPHKWQQYYFDPV